MKQLSKETGGNVEIVLECVHSECSGRAASGRQLKHVGSISSLKNYMTESCKAVTSLVIPSPYRAPDAASMFHQPELSLIIGSRHRSNALQRQSLRFSNSPHRLREMATRRSVQVMQYTNKYGRSCDVWFILSSVVCIWYGMPSS